MARRKHPAAIETLIGADTVLRGDVNFTGGLYLEGRIEGNVDGGDAEAHFDINESGRVVGEVRVANVTVNGAIEGELHANERLILGATARIEGNVFYHVLEMTAGAEVNGKLSHREQSEPLAIEHKPPEGHVGGVEVGA
ncbi:MAG: bactofilin family protein [Gammaproteobacteria bacterium]